MHTTRRAVITAIAAGVVTPSFTLADEAPPPLSLYGRLPEIEDIAISPDGQRVAYITSIKGDRVVYDQSLKDGSRKGVLIAKSKVRALFYGDNERVVVITSAAVRLQAFVGGRDEYYLGLILDLNRNKTHKLFDNMEDFYSIVTGNFRRITVKGESRVTASNIKLINEGVSSLYSFSLKNGTGRLMDESAASVIDWVIMPDGEPVGRSLFDTRKGVWTLQYNDPDNNKGWRTIYEQAERVDYPSLSGLGRDGKSMVLYIHTGENGGDYYEISPQGVLSEPLETPGTHISPIFHPVSRHLAGFVSTQEERRTYHMYDKVMSALAKAVDDEFNDFTLRNIVDFAEDPRKMIIYLESKDFSGRYIFIDFGTGAMEVIADTRPDLPNSWVGEKKRITYKAGDGLDIPAFVTMPPAQALRGRMAENLPLVVMPHGGPQLHDGYGFDWMSQALASRGYVVLQPNFRGSSGYGHSFTEAGHGQWGRKMQTDLSDGVSYLASEGLIDPKRVAIVGGSYGGYAALAGAALQPGLYNCAVALSPISNLKSFVRWVRNENGLRDNSPAVLYWKRFMGDETGWDEVSPDLNAAQVQCPVLLIHGHHDTVVPFAQSDMMMKALHRAGKPCELITLKQEDHWLSLEPTRIQALEAMVDFLMKHNPPG